MGWETPRRAGSGDLERSASQSLDVGRCRHGAIRRSIEQIAPFLDLTLAGDGDIAPMIFPFRDLSLSCIYTHSDSISLPHNFDFFIFPSIEGRAGWPWSTAVFRILEFKWPRATPLLERILGSPRASASWCGLPLYSHTCGVHGTLRQGAARDRNTLRTVHSASALLNAFEARPLVKRNMGSIAWGAGGVDNSVGAVKSKSGV